MLNPTRKYCRKAAEQGVVEGRHKIPGRLGPHPAPQPTRKTFLVGRKFQASRHQRGKMFSGALRYRVFAKNSVSEKAGLVGTHLGPRGAEKFNLIVEFRKRRSTQSANTFGGDWLSPRNGDADCCAAGGLCVGLLYNGRCPPRIGSRQGSVGRPSHGRCLTVSASTSPKWIMMGHNNLLL